jgi:mRNA interferase MazF
VRRGDIVRLRLRPKGGHAQHGVRYGVIVQADALLPLSTILVAPTSRSARPASFRPEIDINGTTTRVLVEQVGAVDVSRLGKPAGHLSAQEQWGVDLAIALVLGLG